MIVRARFRHPHPGRAVVGTGGGTAVFLDGEGAVEESVLRAWQAAGIAVDLVSDAAQTASDQDTSSDIAASDGPAPDETATPEPQPASSKPAKRTRTRRTA